MLTGDAGLVETELQAGIISLQAFAAVSQLGSRLSGLLARGVHLCWVPLPAVCSPAPVVAEGPRASLLGALSPGVTSF